MMEHRPIVVPALKPIALMAKISVAFKVIFNSLMLFFSRCHRSDPFNPFGKNTMWPNLY
jgi:hypothetical protein